MRATQLEKLKREIEEYRKRLEEELSRKNQLDSVERTIQLSRNLDELIVKYEQALKKANSK